MEVLPLFSQPVYINMVELTDTIISDVSNTDVEHIESEYINNGSMSLDTQWLTSSPETMAIVDNEMDRYVHDVLGIARQRHYIQHQSSWVNYHREGDSAAQHSHVNSMFSGCLYIKTPPESGEFRFNVPAMSPTYITQTVNPDLSESNIYNMREVSIQPEEGMVILFPSHLPHSVSKCNTNLPRYSVAFNYFIKGVFGNDIDNLRL